MAGKGKTAEVMKETTETAAEKPKQRSSVYTMEELAENASALFGVRRECVTAALKNSDITACTLAKAREIVKAFMHKEVR